VSARRAEWRWHPRVGAAEARRWWHPLLVHQTQQDSHQAQLEGLGRPGHGVRDHRPGRRADRQFRVRPTARHEKQATRSSTSSQQQRSHPRLLPPSAMPQISNSCVPTRWTP